MFTQEEIKIASKGVQKLLFWANSGYDEDLEPHFSDTEKELSRKLCSEFYDMLKEEDDEDLY